MVSKKLLVIVALFKVLSIMIGFWAGGMYMLGILRNAWLSTVIWAIGCYITWSVFERYMREIQAPENWIKPIDRPTQGGKKIWQK